MPAPRPPSPQWSLPASLLALGVGMPAIFWLKFGYVDGYAYGVTGFLLLLVLAVHYLPRKTAELAAHSEASEVAPGRFDFLGVVWLLSVPFAPFFGWLLTSVTDVHLGNWRVLVTVRAALCVALPLVCVLPLLRYVRGRPAAFQCAVLGLGTLFPVLTGWGAARDAVCGPQWQDVVVERLEDIRFRTGAGTRVDLPEAFVHLSDGRRLTHATRVTLRLGPARVLVLPGMGRILEVN